MFRRIAFLLFSVVISLSIIQLTRVAKRTARHGEPLLRQSAVSGDASADATDPASVGILPSPPALRAGPTQSIFGPNPSSANPIPAPVNLHPRDLAATPLPSAPLIAGGATNSVQLTKPKPDPE